MIIKNIEFIFCSHEKRGDCGFSNQSGHVLSTPFGSPAPGSIIVHFRYFTSGVQAKGFTIFGHEEGGLKTDMPGSQS